MSLRNVWYMWTYVTHKRSGEDDSKSIWEIGVLWENIHVRCEGPRESIDFKTRGNAIDVIMGNWYAKKGHFKSQWNKFLSIEIEIDVDVCVRFMDWDYFLNFPYFKLENAELPLFSHLL